MLVRFRNRCQLLAAVVTASLCVGCISPSSWNPIKKPTLPDTFENPMARFRSQPKNVDGTGDLVSSSLGGELGGLSEREQRRFAKELSTKIESATTSQDRIDMVRSLGRLPTDEAIGGLQHALRDEDMEVRIAACEALGHQRSTDALRLLSMTLQDDESTEVRLAATRALGDYQGPAQDNPFSISAKDESRPFESIVSHDPAPQRSRWNPLTWIPRKKSVQPEIAPLDLSEPMTKSREIASRSTSHF